MKMSANTQVYFGKFHKVESMFFSNFIYEKELMSWSDCSSISWPEIATSIVSGTSGPGSLGNFNKVLLTCLCSFYPNEGVQKY